jgi:hypothetical protein
MARLGRGVLALAVLLAAASCSGEARVPDEEALRTIPLWVSAGAQSGIDVRPAWGLIVTPGPGTQVLIQPGPAPDGSLPEEQTLELELTVERWELLREALLAEDVLGLPERLGSAAGAGAQSWIQVESGDQGHTVRLFPGAEAARDEVRRYARVFTLLRGWAEERAGHSLLPDHLP